MVEAAAHTALHASLNATLHTTLDLSQRIGRHHQDRGCENPFTEHGCVAVWHSVNHCTVGSLENKRKGKRSVIPSSDTSFGRSVHLPTATMYATAVTDLTR